MILQYAETAKKQSFEALCRLHPLVKTYRDKVVETSEAMVQAESSLGDEAPVAYLAALAQVKEGFTVHVGALDEWMSALAQKEEALSDQAMTKAKQSGAQLESALNGLTIKE